MKNWITRRSTLYGTSLSGGISCLGSNMVPATARDTSESTPTSTWTKCDSQQAVSPCLLQHSENLLPLNVPLRQAYPFPSPLRKAVVLAFGSSKRTPNSRVRTVLVILPADQAVRTLQPRSSLPTVTQRYQHAFGRQRNAVLSKLRRLRPRRRVRTIYLASTRPSYQRALRGLPPRLLKHSCSLEHHRPSALFQSLSSACLARATSHRHGRLHRPRKSLLKGKGRNSAPREILRTYPSRPLPSSHRLSTYT